MKTFILISLLLTQILSEEISFPTAMKNLELLESYAKSYKATTGDKTSITQLVTSYIRESKYTGLAWQIVAGTCPSNFKTYITEMDQKSNTNVATVLKYGDIKVRTSEKIDFVHLFAVINGLSFVDSYTKEASGLVGWAGDLAQLFQDVKNANPNTLEGVYNAANEYLGKKGGFGAADLISDLDAPIILEKVKKTNKSFASVITEYYENEKFTHSSRIKEFISLTFPDVKEITKSNLRNAVYNSYSKNSLIKILECTYGFRSKAISCKLFPGDLLSQFKNHPQAVCNAFADYLFNNSK